MGITTSEIESTVFDDGSTERANLFGSRQPKPIIGAQKLLISSCSCSSMSSVWIFQDQSAKRASLRAPCPIKSSMSAVVDDRKASRTLKPFDKRCEGLLKSLVGFFIWNQGSFDQVTIGLAKDRSRLIYLSTNSKIVVLPTEQKNVHSSVGMLNV